MDSLDWFILLVPLVRRIWQALDQIHWCGGKVCFWFLCIRKFRMPPVVPVPHCNSIHPAGPGRFPIQLRLDLSHHLWDNHQKCPSTIRQHYRTCRKIQARLVQAGQSHVCRRNCFLHAMRLFHCHCFRQKYSHGLMFPFVFCSDFHPARQILILLRSAFCSHLR